MAGPTDRPRASDGGEVREALDNARQELLGRRTGARWEGHLSSSALSTATSVVALGALETSGVATFPGDADLIGRGSRWLAAHQNADGGWGDTPASPSNISTTVLGWAACGSARHARDLARAGAAAERWIARAVGSMAPEAIASAIAARYGKDRTFSAPILLVCALTDRLGPDGWRLVPQLPFEIAACPRAWFHRLRLPVVSYALPALIAIGYARHRRRPSANPIARSLRRTTARRTLNVLEQIQPSSGGFLEAVPLTAFVVMSLAAGGRSDGPVAQAGARFLRASARPDGSWPIDTNLSTWGTTLAVNALGRGPLEESLPPESRAAIAEGLLGQQYRAVHPYTLAPPGGWAWTDLPGGVPDADDTAGALLALRRLGPPDARVVAAARAGVNWLLRRQNADGGIPTFCRGWTNLPFDRSGSDLTAHAVRAWTAWRGDWPEREPQIGRATARALRYLARTQRADGAWVPLWFGNQSAPLEENPTYGTSRVLVALHETAAVPEASITGPLIGGATRWLLAAQNADGGWGGAPDTPSSIEETALAVSALTAGPRVDQVGPAIDAGAAWLVRATEGGRVFPPSPIGLYFAKLWYSEDLYPIVFTVAALEAVAARPSAGCAS